MRRQLATLALFSLIALVPTRISAQSNGWRENTPTGGVFHPNTPKSSIGFYYGGQVVVMRPNGRWGLADYPLVVRVDSGSIADSVGMKVNDVIVTVNGRDTRDARAFDRRPGETGLVMRIRRGDEEKEIVIQFPPRGP